jgi:anaerobic magnesium-protoporphyrin IX monomethyl ester cyclase
MKISISYPPIESKKGIPTLSQNRQFQWFSSPTYIYPVVPAYAATLLVQNGNVVFWDDGIAEGMKYGKWLERIITERPDIIAIETKTPVIKRHWEIIRELKEKLPSSKIVLMGDHVTAMPRESIDNCPVDYILTGGDYDFMLLNLANHLSRDEKLLPGWFSKEGSTGKFELKYSLDDLPKIDRELTQWKLYSQKNGNFKHTPGSYIMSSRDCWYGGCSFCSWVSLFPRGCNRTRSAERMLDEIGELIDLGVKEIFEDSGTLPIGGWLDQFCKGMIERGYNKKVTLSCNMRINGIKDPEKYSLMKEAGFRMVLFGLESANQKTLDRLNKGLKVEEIESGLKLCKDAGLEPHITVMVGYPWETKGEAQKTMDVARVLFKKGVADSLQATILIPYPGTELYSYCRENDLLLTSDYDKYDQRQSVMKSELTDVDIKKMTRSLYRSFISPEFFVRKIKGIKSFSDIKHYLKSAGKVIAHLFDFQ